MSRSLARGKRRHADVMAIQVRGIVWVGTRTDAFEESVRFFRDVLGNPLAQPTADFAWARRPCLRTHQPDKYLTPGLSARAQ